MWLNERRLAFVSLAVLAFAGAAGAALLRHVDPNAADSFLPACVFYAATELYCAGCGMTRALHALVHGDMVRAMEMNPLSVLLPTAIPLMLLHLAGWRPQVLAPLMRVLNSGAFWLVLLPGFWIARNLPWAPFAWLAPG